MRTHTLKTWPEPFAKIVEGVKRAEFRRLDREFEVGDTLLLQEFDPETQAFTGREVYAAILDITTGFGIPEGFGMLSVELCSKVELRNVSDDHHEIIERSSDDGRYVVVWNVGPGFYLASNKEDFGLRHWTSNPKYAETFEKHEAQNLLDFGEVIDEKGKLYKIKDVGAIILKAVTR